jgi:hypothetical protein
MREKVSKEVKVRVLNSPSSSVHPMPALKPFMVYGSLHNCPAS